MLTFCPVSYQQSKLPHHQASRNIYPTTDEFYCTLTALRQQ